jgi:divalent metal cation (Fe/Co/Zn/Cd) transporter
MNLKKRRNLASLIIGIIVSIIGVFLIITYAMKAYVDRAGEPDQSLLFWYLAILLLGIAALGLGLSITVLRLLNLRNEKNI